MMSDEERIEQLRQRRGEQMGFEFEQEVELKRLFED